MQNFMKTILSALQTWTKGKIKDSTADWNQNDSGKDSYVKNRPFWKDDDSNIYLVDSQGLNFSLADSNIWPYSMSDSTLYAHVVDGFSYTNYGVFSEDNGYGFDTDWTVIWDGVEYKCSTYDNDYLIIGNTNIAFSNSDIYTEPFAIVVDVYGVYDSRNMYIITTDSSITHTVKLFYFQEGKTHVISTDWLPPLVGKFYDKNRGAEIFNSYNTNTASGDFSHAEGSNTTASNYYSHAEGNNTIASGNSSHAEGSNTTASNYYSHAEGYNTTANGEASHAEGYNTTASHAYQHVEGRYNILDPSNSSANVRGTYIHIAGNGTSNTKRSNAHTLDWNGNAWYRGGVYVGSTSGTNRDDGSKKLATEEYVINAITDSAHTKRQIVDALPDVSEAEENVIYMMFVSSVLTGDKYEEYMLIDGALIQIGDTSIDLSGYAKTEDIPAKMPNPHALTFTGAVDVVYDGSAPLSVNIPDGTVAEEQIARAVKDYMAENTVSRGGLSTTASELLIKILRGGVYSTDQSANIDALAAEFGVTEEEPDEPVVPDVPEVILSSISATYSGGDVAVGTTVSDLTGIVVTATYSDGSTATVTDYTLSGEIAEGSNTISVSYGGKTTTFTVTGVAESGGETEGVAVMMLDEAAALGYFDWYQDDALIQQKADNTQSAVKANGSNFNWYTDEGATPYTGSIATRSSIQCYTSETVFDEDTEVKVLIKTYGEQAYDLYAIGCTPDWDGISAPSGKNVYNCQKIGDDGWKNGIDHEITYMVKAGTRLFIASFTSTVKIYILNPDTTLNEVSAPNIKNMSISQAVFEKDTQVRIVASSTAQQYDSMVVGCTDHDGSLVSNGVYRGFDIFFVEPVGDIAWEGPPYSVDFTYTVKAGYRLAIGAYWTRADMDVFTVTEVA